MAGETLIPASNDIGPAYMDHRIRLAQASAADELLSRVRLREQQVKPEGAAAVPATSPAQSGVGESQGSLPGRIVKDVARGVVEAPRAVATGVRDAVASMLKMGDELSGWLEEKSKGTPLEFMNSGVAFDKDGARLVGPKEGGNTPTLQTNELLPDLEDPKSVTGGLVKGVSQFLTGMKGAGKLLKEAKIGDVGYSTAALKGAIANFSAFDPHQQRLSNLIEQFPTLQNPVTEFLAADPSDGAAEGRFKNALEGLGLGLMTDGFFKGVKLLRDSSVAKKAAEVVDDAAKVADAVAAPPELPPDAFKDLGSEAANAPLVKLRSPKGALDDVTGAAKAGSADGETFINFARIDSPDDVKSVMQRLADISKPEIDDARRGKQTFAQTKLNASQQDAWQVLMERRAGAPLNAEQSVAARELWVSSTSKLTQLAEAAAASPSEGNLFAFRKMLAVHDAVQREVIAARTETARALSSWRIPAGSSVERLRDVAAALDSTGGSEVARELATRVAKLGRAGMVTEMAAVAEKGAYATTRDAGLEAWINGLLSSPPTHMANTVSNTSVMFLRMAERATAAKISSLLGEEGGVAAGEAASQWFGLNQGLQDMFRYYGKLGRAFVNEDVPAWEAAKKESPLQQLRIAPNAKVEHPPSISSEAFNLSSGSWLGRAADLGGMAVRIPGGALGLEDEFFKTLGYRMELSAQALRQATSEVHAGKVPADSLKTRIAELIAEPPQNLHLAAIDAATYQTFTNTPGKLAQSISKLTAHYPALKVILPFVKTPANIMKFTFERTPLAPVMSKWRADVAAGGSRRDLALAQTALGTAAMLSFADMALSGRITGRGPVEKGEKAAMAREGWQPYSMKAGDRWISYNRLDPIGSLVGMSADAAEMLMQAQHDSLDDPDTEKLLVASSLAFAGNITNKTYLSGLSSVIEALNDPQRSAESFVQRLAGSVIPAGVAQVERLEDPTVREVYSMMDAIRARTPGLSDKLPPRLDMWGEPLKTESGIGKPFDAIAPVYTRKPTPEPIDQEILRVGANVTMPPRRTSFNGVTIDLSQYPKAYSRYVELAGNGLKHPAWGVGAKDFLNAVVSGKHPLSAVYQIRSDGPDGGKDVFIRDAVRQYRELARAQLLQEFPGLKADVEDRQSRQRELKMPVMSQ